MEHIKRIEEAAVDSIYADLRLRETDEWTEVLVKDKASKTPFDEEESYPSDISRFCRDNGVWLRRVGHKFIISPALIFTKKNVDDVVEVLDAAYSAVSL